VREGDAAAEAAATNRRYLNPAAIRSANAAIAWLVPEATFALSSDGMSIEIRS
jgi:hypothetical protein